jgi:hypothetical protein
LSIPRPPTLSSPQRPRSTETGGGGGGKPDGGPGKVPNLELLQHVGGRRLVGAGVQVLERQHFVPVGVCRSCRVRCARGHCAHGLCMIIATAVCHRCGGQLCMARAYHGRSSLRLCASTEVPISSMTSPRRLSEMRPSATQLSIIAPSFCWAKRWFSPAAAAARSSGCMGWLAGWRTPHQQPRGSAALTWRR